MATIKTKELPETGSEIAGILHPAMKHKFRVLFPNFLATTGTEDQDLLSRQVVNCKFDFLKRTITLNLEVPAAFNVMQLLVEQLVKDPDILVFEVLHGGTDQRQQALTFCLDKCLEHSLDFDYADSGAAFHHLVFKYIFFDGTLLD